jgi:hypothetical protein
MPIRYVLGHSTAEQPHSLLDDFDRDKLSRASMCCWGIAATLRDELEVWSHQIIVEAFSADPIVGKGPRYVSSRKDTAVLTPSHRR